MSEAPRPSEHMFAPSAPTGQPIDRVGVLEDVEDGDVDALIAALTRIHAELSADFEAAR
ncbi:hypothetical protein H8R18_03525 [Nanchangia anserum]|uniref:FXSXX-COOH protein n=1 Tax=Nanchangia anserum TaxID=2692125 RepID=A0A8I0GD14_9ACTO|nr:hypothetical protein [Nanchangia anserum]MBD3688632.1 hypothetical protein [Nanchangia anserum]QOX82393.1 hypothetical protein H8R18_03525 [Nanchangia anserum]